MANIHREPGLNSGIPDHDGLDEGTRASIEASLNKEGKGVIVGGIQDVQRFFGELAKDENEPSVQLPPGEDASSPTSMEHDAATGVGTAASAPAFDDSFTVDELKAELEAQGKTTSGTKQELIDRANEK